MANSRHPLIVALVALVPLGGSDQARADRLDILAYNTWMRPAVLFPGEVQRPRSQLLPHELRGYDVLVLAELFDATARVAVLRGLAAQGYHYVTRRLGKDSLFVKDGGVVIASRWPIVAEAQQLFGVCANTHLCLGQSCLVGDCNARKGVLYACIEQRGQRYHLFGSHAQASQLPAAKEARAKQIKMIREFIDSRHIPPGEPVIVAGDLNVDQIGSRAEYQRMLRVLGARPPPSSPPRAGLRYSDDPQTNIWAREDSPRGPRQVIDHILISEDHLKPTRSVIEIRAVRAGGLDLSDHHAVYARLEFPVTREVQERRVAHQAAVGRSARGAL